MEVCTNTLTKHFIKKWNVKIESIDKDQDIKYMLTYVGLHRKNDCTLTICDSM